MDIGAGIAAVTGGLSIAKSLKAIESSYDQALLKAKIAEIYEAFSDAKLALVDAKEALSEHAQEIERLKSTAEERINLVSGAGGYSYRTDSEGNPSGFPVCPKCDPVDGRLIKLVQDGAVDTAKCPICQSQFRPVTCYTGNGSTLMLEFEQRRSASIARQNETMSRINRRIF